MRDVHGEYNKSAPGTRRTSITSNNELIGNGGRSDTRYPMKNDAVGVGTSCRCAASFILHPWQEQR